MATVGLLRELLRYKLLVGIVAVLAILAGMALSYRIGFPPRIESRQHQVGLATTSALVDTPSSQVVDLGGKASPDGAALPGRAALLANLLTSSPLKEEIARRAAIDPRTLIASASVGGDVAASPSAKPSVATGTTVRAGDPRASTLTLVTDTTLPIINVTAESRDVATATRLANGTVAVLQAHLSSLAGLDGVPSARRLVVKQLGEARSGVETRGPSRLLAIVLALVLFVLGCAAILTGSHVVAEWRRVSELERMAEEFEADADQASTVESLSDRVKRAV
jgi:hypothetical protein